MNIYKNLQGSQQNITKK
uniref:Uncharacterized protein n=1 Tax=Rhizophora mucronata TaxID=61149 RepID=A0A2P2KWF7_RHIMU